MLAGFPGLGFVLWWGRSEEVSEFYELCVKVMGDTGSVLAQGYVEWMIRSISESSSSKSNGATNEGITHLGKFPSGCESRGQFSELPSSSETGVLG